MCTFDFPHVPRLAADDSMRGDLGSVEVGGREIDREGEHRKLIMGVGPIGELDASGGDELGTELPRQTQSCCRHEILRRWSRRS